MTHDTLEFPALDDQPATPSPKNEIAVAATGALDLSKVNLTDVALAQFGKWRDKTADARKTLTGVQHDLSTQAKIDDAKSLRHRLINVPLADARKVSKALKSKLNTVSAEVGAELAAIEADYAGVALLISPQIEARESQLAKEKAEREEAEAARKKVHTDGIAKIAGYVALAAELGSERIATGITFLAGLDLSGFEEYVTEATETRDRTLAALRTLHVKAKAREDEEARLQAERAEQARIAAEQAETARQLKAQQDELDRQRTELKAAQEAEERRQQEREAAERRQREEQEAQARREQAVTAAAQDLMETGTGVTLTTMAPTGPDVAHIPSDNVRPMPTRAPAAPSIPTLKLGDIKARLAPLEISAAGLAQIGFKPAAREGAAVLFHEADFPQMVEAMRELLAAALRKQLEAA